MAKLKVDGAGFLTSPLPNIEAAVPGSNRALFDLCLEISAHAEGLVAQVRLTAMKGDETAEEKQKVIALIAFVRLLDVLQSIIILSAHGIREELSSLFRVFLDAYFVLANFCSNVRFIPVFFRSDIPERLKLMNVAARYKDGELFARLNEYASEEVRSELDTKVKEDNIQALNSWLYADQVGCAHIYDSKYRIESASVHTSPRCLGNYMDTDEEGNVLAIVRRSDAETTNQVLYDLASFTLKAISGFAELLSLDIAEDRAEFERRLEVAAQGRVLGEG